ncbi:MAG: hypothetical protein LC734_00370, partial [Acidobacteria bacterium]|nr:hypothetical protein [Acidobacteriota bacterium]
MKPKKSLLRQTFIIYGLLATALLFTGCGKLMEYSNSNNNTQPQRTATPALAEQTNTSSAPAPGPAVPA